MRHRDAGPMGEVKRLWVESHVLKGNMLRDSARRAIDVYLPPGSDPANLPLLVDLAGFTGSGLGHTNWKNFSENVPERLDRLIHFGQMGPAVVVFPDCFTRLGGNQYVNSAAIGNYADFLIQEVVPMVEREFECGGAGNRGVFGKSSGGFGAIWHGMHYPDFWSAVACHSGDMAFELCYLPDIPVALMALDRHGGSVEGFIRSFEASIKKDDKQIGVLMTLAMAASYDPDPSVYLGIRLPVDHHTCSLIEDRWARWLAHDPVRIVDNHADALRGLKGLWIDCGDQDQFKLHFGARRLHARLEVLGVRHVYEEFPDNHFGIDYRMDVSLPYLVGSLSREKN